MTTLFSLTLDLARMLTNVAESMTSANGAAGGTTLVDTARYEPDAYYDQGTVWLLTGLNAANSRVITTYDLPTTTITVPAFANQVLAATRYAVADRLYPRWLLWQCLSRVVRRLILPLNNTALVTVAGQEAYVLPASIEKLLRVEIATELVAPLDYSESFGWDEIAGALRFRPGHAPETAGYTIRLTYTPRPAELTLDADIVSDQLPRETVLWEAKKEALRWRVGKTGKDEPRKLEELNEALVEAERMLSKFPVPNQAAAPKHSNW